MLKRAKKENRRPDFTRSWDLDGGMGKSDPVMEELVW